MVVRGVEERAQDAALGGATVKGLAAEVTNYDLHHLWSAGQKKSSAPDP